MQSALEESRESMRDRETRVEIAEDPVGAMCNELARDTMRKASIGSTIIIINYRGVYQSRAAFISPLTYQRVKCASTRTFVGS